MSAPTQEDPDATVFAPGAPPPPPPPVTFQPPALVEETTPPPAPPAETQEKDMAQAQNTPPADEPAGLQVGDVVRFQHRDAITGDLLTGRGVIARPVAGGAMVAIAPLSGYVLEVDPDGLSPVELEQA